MQLTEEWHDFRFDGIVKLTAIRRGVIKPPARPKNVRQIIIKSSVVRNLAAELAKLVKLRVKIFSLL